MDLTEKRKRPRYLYHTPVIYRELGSASLGRVEDLGEGGVMVMLTERFPVGTPLDLVVPLGERSVRAQAEVVWAGDPSPENGGAYPHRMKFTRLEFQDQLNLELFLAIVFDAKSWAGDVGSRERDRAS